MTRRLPVVALFAAAFLLTAAAANAGEPKLVQRTIPVADLVVPLENHVWASYPDPETSQRESGKNLDRLIRLITNTIAPTSWADVGGPGTIDYFPRSMALVVSQTRDVQDQIAELLASLRRLQDDQVAIELRVVTISPETAEYLLHYYGIDWRLDPPATFFSDAQLFQFMEALQQDKHTDIMQAPKLTLFNGQTSTMRIGEFQYFVTDVQILQVGGQLAAFVPQTRPVAMGVQMDIQAVMAANDTAVRVGLHGTITDLVSKDIRLVPVTRYLLPDFEGGAQGQPVPFTQYVQRPEISTVKVDQTLSIPADKTAVLSGGWRTVETCADWRVAMEKWAPCLKDWLQVGGTPEYTAKRSFDEIVKDLAFSCSPQPDNPGKRHATFGEIVKDLLWSFGKQREGRYVLVLVTPHIVHNEEETAEQTVAVPVAAPPAPAHSPVVPAAFADCEEKSIHNEAEAARQTCPAYCAENEEANFFDDVKKDIARLLADKYHQAVREGRLAEAKLLAEKALSFDPTCFDADRGK
jgi:hypothetical protein